MKKGFVRRAGLLGIVLAMAVGLCACGKAGDGMENAALAKENVYKMQEIKLPELYEKGMGNMGVQATGHVDGKVMMLVQVWNWGSGSNDPDLRLMTFAEDGSDLQVKQLEMPTSQQETDNDGNEVTKPVSSASPEDEEYPEDTPVDYSIAMPLPGGVAIPVPDVEAPVEDDVEVPDADAPADDDFEVSDEEMPPEYDFGYSNTYDYTGYYRFLLTSTGQIYGVKRVTHEDWDHPENSYTRYFLVHWDPEGRFQDETVLEGLESSEEEYIDIRTMAEARDGSVYLIIGVNETFYNMVMGTDGRISGKKAISDSAQTLFKNYERVIPEEPGQLYVVYRGDGDDWSKMYGASYDFEADAVSRQMELPSTIRSGWNYSMMVRGNSDNLLYTTDSGISAYKIGDAESKPKMDYVNSDLYIADFYTVLELSDDSFLGIYNEDWESGAKAGIFTYVRPEDIVDKKTLVLAGTYIYNDTKKRVIEYNRNNQEYRIVLRSYQQYNTEENEYTGAVTQLNNDIISGKMPDILIGMDSSLPIENYISKGLIADIGKLIEQDEELSKVEFLQNVFDAYSVNGKLYYVVPQFMVNTMVAKDSLTNGRDSWNMNDMQQVLAGMGENAMAIGETTRGDFMYMVMSYCGNQFVNLSTGKCSFNTDDFIRMMEFAKTLPEKINYDDRDDSYWENYWENYQSQYRENRTLLMPCYISGFEYFVENIKGYFGDDFAFVGFPADNGGGSYIDCNISYVLSAKSPNLDGAWNFVKYYLGEEYQKDLRMPVRKDLFMERARKMTERPYWEDENGNKEYYDYTTWINGEMIVLEPFTEEQMNQVLELIESVDNRYYYDREIMKIMEEEIDAFFTGQKSAAEVADIIQRRAQIYVDTNR